MKLNAAQKAALDDIRSNPGKSGAFWRDLGNPIVSLLALERKGLVRADSRGYSSPLQWQWWAESDATPQGER